MFKNVDNSCSCLFLNKLMFIHLCHQGDTAILPKDLITFQLSHIATAPQDIAPILEM